MILPPQIKATGQREIAWLIGGLWLLGFAAMTAFALVVGFEKPGVSVVRAGLMALVGAGLCMLLWRTLASVRWSLPARVALLAIGIVAAIAAHTAIDAASADLVRDAFGRRGPVSKVIAPSKAGFYIMSFVIASNGLLYTALYAVFGMAAVALRSATEARGREQLLSEARAATAGAQLAMLRYQLNPHFVFNTLNAIGSLVETGRAQQAGTMIDKLADFLRSSLGSAGETFSTVEEELSTIQTYLDIEATRFASRLRVEYDVSDGVPRALMPSFLLQPLVENAVKYAVAPAMRPVTLRLTARADDGELVIAVEDDGPGSLVEAAARVDGTGIGLANVRERLALLYGPAGRLEAGAVSGGFTAVVRLPLRLAEHRAAA
jgi:signal transduction histidine kinase